MQPGRQLVGERIDLLFAPSRLVGTNPARRQRPVYPSAMLGRVPLDADSLGRNGLRRHLDETTPRHSEASRVDRPVATIVSVRCRFGP